MEHWRSGKQLNNGKYIVEKWLGSGAYSVTYKVREVRPNELFAIKTLNATRQQQANFGALQTKFVNEIIALANCRHPNIVRVYPRVFQEEGLWCMVMDFIEGKDLAEYIITQGKFRELDAIEIVTKVGNALSHVHHQGLLHRDIKPANILLQNKDRVPIVIDFGLAREYTPGAMKSMTDSKTEGYAPIEQYQRNGNFGAWTDVYALAATLYALLTATTPTPSELRQQSLEHNAQDILISPQKHNPEISHRVNAAILKGLAFKPENRPQTVAQWLGLLATPKTKPTKKVIDSDVSKHTQLSPTPNKPPQIPKKSRNERKPKDTPVSTVTRRGWLKYAGLGVSAIVVALVGNNFRNDSTTNQLATDEYSFEVVTVNSKGEEINREPGKASYFTEDLGNGVTLDMVYIPGGTFMMGSPEDEPKRDSSESSQHRVKVPDFYLGKFQVTQAQYQAVMGNNPANFQGDNLPVEKVSWDNAVEFCQQLSSKTGKEYQLPSEAQWEYACRAGTTTPFYFGDTITTDLVNYNGDYTYVNEPKGEDRNTTTPVGSFPPNAFGLCDMHGNVWEWCADKWHINYNSAPDDLDAWVLGNSNDYVIRGGSWSYKPGFCRSAFRLGLARDDLISNLGFRIAFVVFKTT